MCLAIVLTAAAIVSCMYIFPKLDIVHRYIYDSANYYVGCRISDLEQNCGPRLSASSWEGDWDGEVYVGFSGMSMQWLLYKTRNGIVVSAKYVYD